jgi:hypothetical protein
VLACGGGGSTVSRPREIVPMIFAVAVMDGMEVEVSSEVSW